MKREKRVAVPPFSPSYHLSILVRFEPLFGRREDGYRTVFETHHPIVRTKLDASTAKGTVLYEQKGNNCCLRSLHYERSGCQDLDNIVLAMDEVQTDP